MLKRSLVFASLVVTSAAHAAVLYNNTNTATDTTDFYSTTRNFFADDFDISSSANGSNPSASVTGLNFGYVTLNDAVSFDVVVSFYQNLDLVSTSSTTSVLSPSTPLFSQRFSFINVAIGANGTHETGLLSLANGGFTLPSYSTNGTFAHGITVAFYNPGTTTLSTNAVGLFKGNIAPTVGSSDSTFFTDRNGNGIFDGSDRTSAGTALTRNNYYFSLQGTINATPEPGTWAALGLGAVAVLRRRKRA